jgi:hypothetical protein
MVNNISDINKTKKHLTSQKKNPAPYGIQNPGPYLGQAQSCGRFKLENGISVLPFLIMKESPTTVYNCILSEVAATQCRLILIQTQ